MTINHVKNEQGAPDKRPLVPLNNMSAEQVKTASLVFLGNFMPTN